MSNKNVHPKQIAKAKKQEQAAAEALEQEQLTPEWQKKLPLIAIMLAVIVAMMIFGVVNRLTNDQRSPEMVVEKFFNALYVEGDLEGIQECMAAELAPAVQEQYGTPFIGGSTTLTMYRDNVLGRVGYEDLKVRVEVLEDQRSSAEVLKNVREVYRDATNYHVLQLQVTFTGDLGSYTATAETCAMKRDGGKWFLVDPQILLTDAE